MIEIFFVHRLMASSDSRLAAVQDVDIDGAGRFKYVLIKVTSQTGCDKTIVRGHEWAEYHGESLLITWNQQDCLPCGRHNPMTCHQSAFTTKQQFCSHISVKASGYY